MRVVVVDPSRTVLKFLSRMLAARDYDVRAFADGHEALAHIKSDPEVGALITSAELLTMSGVELCWETRLYAADRRPIYILLMSSHEERRSLVEALDCGADDFIGKPPVPEVLYARLRVASRLTSMQHELIRLATTDPLTGLLNRRAFFEQAHDICARARAGAALSAIMFDLDHFKQVNDSYGHDVGDQSIRAVAREAAREAAILGRVGGEEFAMLLPGQDMAAAAETADALRARVATLRPIPATEALTLTCSFGVAEWEFDDSIDRLLRRADVALYAAKMSGRNRVVTDAAATVADYENAARPVRGSERLDGVFDAPAPSDAVSPTRG